MQVRRATDEDAVAVTELLGQLGYARTVEAVAGRLRRDAGSADDPAWVAVDGDGPVGFVAGHLSRPYELDRPVAEITALVVSAAVRGTGAGRALVTELEAWAAQRGACRVAVSSSVRREGAHVFYEALGYGQRSKRFEKPLTT